MDGRQLIEKLRRQPAHMFAMTGIGVHPSGKAAGLLAESLRALVVSARRTKMRRGQFVQHSFANANARDDELPRIQEFREGGEEHRRHAHDFGAIAPYTKSIYAPLDVKPEDLPEHLL